MAALGKIRSRGVILITVIGFALLLLLQKRCSALAIPCAMKADSR